VNVEFTIFTTEPESDPTITGLFSTSDELDAVNVTLSIVTFDDEAMYSNGDELTTLPVQVP
jgi:hypothetical protein